MRTLSVIIPWRNTTEQRLANFHLLLKDLNGQTYLRSEYEIIVVEQSTCTSIECDKHIIVDQEIFNKSWLINIGIKESSFEHIIVIDADSGVESDFLDKVDKYFTIQRNLPIFNCWSTLIAEPGKDNPAERIIHPNDIRTMGAAWAANKAVLTSTLGGMNEYFFGYGGEDNELYERICAIHNLTFVPNMEATIRHRYHDWVKANPINSRLFETGRSYPKEITERLKAISLGDKAGPKSINISDLEKMQEESNEDTVAI